MNIIDLDGIAEKKPAGKKEPKPPLGKSPVCTILPDESHANRITPNGRKVVICPAQTRDDITCAKCGLCQRADRSCIVGFIPHGAQTKKALAIARAN